MRRAFRVIETPEGNGAPVGVLIHSRKLWDPHLWVRMLEVRPGVPADLQGVVLRCLEKDRERRFADVRSLDEALAGCRPEEPWGEAEAADWWKQHG